jgi:Niemann-Pick C1 protein
MFVIVQCLENLTEKQVSSLSIQERIATAMRHAGVAITVTSLTDVCAFGIGAVTVRTGIIVGFRGGMDF